MKSSRTGQGTDPFVAVAIALGSNLGDRHAHLEYAVTALHLDLEGITVSAFSETQPFGVGEEHGSYLNAVIVGRTALSARDLLDRLLEIEEERGRTRPYPMAPRTLDLDLILYGGAIANEDGMQVPHPRFRERAFVLTPLAEIAPDMIDPVTHQTVSELSTKLHKAQNTKIHKGKGDPRRPI